MRAGKAWPTSPTNCPRPTTTLTDILKVRLAMSGTPTRSDAEFLTEERAKQAAGRLATPKLTGALLDRLETAIRTHTISPWHHVGAQ